MNNLELILEELQNYKRNKNVLMYTYINERLNKSLDSYYKELKTSIMFLNSKDESKLLKKLNKYE